MKMFVVLTILLLISTKKNICAQEEKSEKIATRNCSDYSLIEMLDAPLGERCRYEGRITSPNGEISESSMIVTKKSHLKVGGKWVAEDGKTFYKHLEFYAAAREILAFSYEPVESCKLMNKELISPGYYCETGNGEGYELIAKNTQGRVWYSYVSGYFWFEPSSFQLVNYDDGKTYCSMLSGDYLVWDETNKLSFSIAKSDWIYLEVKAGIEEIYQWPSEEVWTSDYNKKFYTTVSFTANHSFLKTAHNYPSDKSFNVICRGGVDK